MSSHKVILKRTAAIEAVLCEVFKMTTHFKIVVAVALLLLCVQSPPASSYCGINTNGNGVIEGLGNRNRTGSADNLVSQTGPENEGGFSGGEAEVVKTEPPGGGFSGTEGETVRTTRTPRTQTERRRTSRTKEPDLSDFENDPFFNQNNVVIRRWPAFVPRVRIYPRPWGHPHPVPQGGWEHHHHY